MAFKKIMSALMAGALVLSLGVPAFATNTPGTLTLETADPYEFTVEGSTAVPAIKIEVPETVGLIANPYALTVDAQNIGGTATEKGVIISPVQYIKNKSLVDIDVTATVAGYVGGEVEFSATTTNTETTKKAFVTFEMATCDGTTAPVTYPNSAVLKVLGDNDSPVAVGSSALTMAKSTDGTAVASTGAIAFHFKGDLTPAEKVVTTGDSAQAPWNDGDVFGATVVFNFTAKTNTTTTP